VCGIAGIFEMNSRTPVDRAQIASMCRAIVRRGPDDHGMHVDGNMGFGMRRLSIIDVQGGQQPITNEDGTCWIVFNGEIFNHESIRRDLEQRGHVFKTKSDTEAILHLYEDKGPRCLEDLRGMFAIAIWDARSRELFIARDRLGIKPLHYAYDGARFVFGSEIKAVLECERVSRDIDWTGVDTFFTYGYIPAPWTVYKAIRKLEAGHYLVVSDRGLRRERYWDVAMEPKWTASAQDLQHEFIDRLRESVRMRLLSEVPLGAYLSGGLDSTLVVAMMSAASAQPVNTFTIGFGGQTGNFLDERPTARDVAARYRTHHREFEVLPKVEEALDVALQAFDEPFADDSIIPTHHICALARKHVTVALTGLGGDENFAGYERYLGFRASLIAQHAPWRQLIALARPGIRALREDKGGHNRVNHLKRFVEAADLEPGRRWQSYQTVFSQSERRALYAPDVARAVDFEASDRAGSRYFDAVDARDPVDRALYQDLKMYLPDDILALTDRVGMWHSLELRVPFVDHTLVEFCARIPIRHKLHWGEKKHLMRRAARPFLPPSVLNQRKQGFAAPLAIWLRGEMRGFVETSLGDTELARAGVLNSGPVAARLRDHWERRRLNDKQIFAMLMFQRWWAKHYVGDLAVSGVQRTQS
jgi:asparagine synthase (glutamine-hydrolysing)